MIMRVWGLINMNQTLPFHSVGDRWFFDLPDKDGEYICEFWAEDDFGSIGYNRAILYIQGGVLKCLRVISSRYKTTLLASSMRAEDTTRAYSTTADAAPYDIAMRSRRWAVSINLMTCPLDMKEIA